jgi:flagellar assembly factor FliW
MSASATTAELIRLESVLLGPLDIRPETVVSFPAGLPGFVTLRNFALVDTQCDELVWLQSVDDPDLTFLLADPFVMVPGFAVDIPAADLAVLAGDTPEPNLLVLVVTQLEGGVPVSANLQSPIVVNRDTRRGRQVVVPDSRYGMHHAIVVPSRGQST